MHAPLLDAQRVVRIACLSEADIRKQISEVI